MSNIQGENVEISRGIQIWLKMEITCEDLLTESMQQLFTELQQLFTGKRGGKLGRHDGPCGPGLEASMPGKHRRPLLGLHDFSWPVTATLAESTERTCAGGPRGQPLPGT